MRRMQTVRRLIGWIARHLFVQVRNLNQDAEAKPKSAIVVGVRGEF